MIGYYGLLDLGFRSAVVFYSARHRALQEYEELNELISTLVVYFSVIAAVLIGVTFIVAGKADRFFPPSPRYQGDFPQLVLMIGISISSGIVFNVFSGLVDVIVTDGFTGNVMLKLSEGLTEAMLSMLKRELMATAVTKAGAMLAKPAFRNIKKRLDYTEYGGAPLLGVSRIVVIGHGRSNARAIRNAIRSVKEFSEHRTAERIEEGIRNKPQLTQTYADLRVSV